MKGYVMSEIFKYFGGDMAAEKKTTKKKPAAKRVAKKKTALKKPAAKKTVTRAQF
jgi:hypothetical protein